MMDLYRVESFCYKLPRCRIGRRGWKQVGFVGRGKVEEMREETMLVLVGPIALVEGIIEEALPCLKLEKRCYLGIVSCSESRWKESNLASEAEKVDGQISAKLDKMFNLNREQAHSIYDT